MVKEEDKLKLFVNEFNDIKDENLREFAKELISHADDYFFTVAASTTGKYHPQFDLGDGGLVRHTRCVTFFAECIADSHMFSEHDRDLLIIAALAHDIKKLGNGGSKYTVGNHPTCAKEYIELTRILKPELISKEDCDKVCAAVESHMGKWGHESDNLPLPQTEFEKALQSADYIASRKEILDFNFRPTDEVHIEAPKPQKYNGNPKDYVLEFGKHKGKTLEEIKSTGYLDWVAKQETFFNKEAQDIIKEYLGMPVEKGDEAQKISIEKILEPATVTSGEVDDLPF